MAIDDPIQDILRGSPPALAFAVTALAFLVLYLGAAGGVLLLGRVVPALDGGRLKPHQVGDEIRRSLVSVLVFGAHGVAWSLTPEAFYGSLSSRAPQSSERVSIMG